MKENKKHFVTSGILFVAFIIFTFLVKSVDVQPIGPNGSIVGFATINSKISTLLGYNDTFFALSEILGYIGIATVIIFVLFGIMQLFIKKGFSKVDKDLYVLYGLYIFVLGLYILFEALTINYRPVILSEGLEPSYPSTHTMMSISYIGAAIIEFSARLKKERTKKIVVTLCTTDGLGLIVCRVLSGVHWITDIFAGILIASACFLLFKGCFNIVLAKKQDKV